MSHVYRFNVGNNNLDGWDNSVAYGKAAINAIQDPTGGSAHLPITSIPSPFASFELVKDAFKQVVNNNNIDGQTIYNKLISFSLDIAEIFFNYSKYRNDFEIIKWNINADLQTLLNSQDPGIKCLGNTLNLYINQDKKAFNFTNISGIYMLNYKKGTRQLNIIGGTSPTSLFISSTSDDILNETNITLSNNHRAFDIDTKSYLSLYKREPKFFKYIYCMSKILLQGTTFGLLYPEINAYINQCYQLCDVNVRNQLNNITSTNYLNDYNPIAIKSGIINIINGIPLCERTDYTAAINNSDFKIASIKYNNGQLPLVLPSCVGCTNQLTYTTGKWDSNKLVPTYDNNTLSNRILPFEGTKYPYLTVDDFFQPYLIRTAYPINSNFFFTGDVKPYDKEGYLLPLKKSIFEYFNISDLENVLPNNPKIRMFELKQVTLSSMKAILNIPIQKNNYITFERIYYNEISADRKQNKGEIIDCKFDMFLFPFFHIQNVEKNQQRLYLIDEDISGYKKSYDYQIEAFKQNSLVSLECKSYTRADKIIHSDPYTTKYFDFGSEYDYIELFASKKISGLIIPKFKNIVEGNKSFEFAIDFGTTNTHVEYRDTEKPNKTNTLEIGEDDIQIMPLHDYTYTYQNIVDKNKHSDINDLFQSGDMDSFAKAINQEFVPLLIGKDIKFPMRTNICLPRNGDRNNMPSDDYTIGYFYEKEILYTHNDNITNIKWLGTSNDNFSKKLIKSYIEQLIWIIRNKILLNNGQLNRTKIIWFYPLSMLHFQHDNLEKIWDDLCHRYISKDCNIISITESLAPYYYYINNAQVSSALRPVASIDVGGGTTDCVIYKNNIPIIASSVRFAGDNLYGDFFGTNINHNGFINRYEQKIINKITPCIEVKGCYDQIKEKGNSSNLISFMYSLENNPTLAKNNINISLSELLEDDNEMKVVLLLFYCAEIYQIANLMNKRGIKQTPCYLTFSGTESKMFNLIGSGLKDITKLFFNDILEDYGDIDLKMVDGPKEITCKGGLMINSQDELNNIDKIKDVYYGSLTLDKECNPIYDNIDNNILKEIIDNYYNFINLFFKINEDFSYKDYFGIILNQSYKEILTKYAKQDLATVIDYRKKQFENSAERKEINDSLFFFPLSGGINRLAYYISQKK